MSVLPVECPPAAIETDALPDFCRAVVSRHSEHWPVSEDVLAEEFLTFFGLRSFLTFQEMVHLCQERLRIPVSFLSLPEQLKGHNNSYGDKREIVISLNQDFSEAKLHTLLHELRETLEHEFEKLGLPIANREDLDLEDRAELFAISLQICAAINLLPVLFDNAHRIERKWLRIISYVLLGAGALAYALACASVPQVENAFAAQRLSKRC